MTEHYIVPKDTANTAATRDGFGKALAQTKDERVVVLTADLAQSTRVDAFAKKHPHRFFEIGVAEQNMVGMAAGMAHAGAKPFACSFAAFNPGRTFDQIRVSVCYSDLPVTIVGSHAGLTVGEDGATHQMLEDIAMMRALPNMRVFVPADAEQARIVTHLAVEQSAPTYLRLGRLKVSPITPKDTPHTIGKARVLMEGTDVAIIACGVMLAKAIHAALALSKEGVSVTLIDNWCVKPLDTQTLLAAAKRTHAIVVAEEHQRAGGLFSAISEVLAQTHPVPIQSVAVEDTFGESGTGEELLEHYGLTTQAIIDAAITVMERKAERTL